MASGRYPLHMCLWGSLSGWALYDLQTRRFYYYTQRHTELRDLEADFVSMVCSDVEIEPVLQDICGEHLNRGSNKAQDARLDIHARGFWERHRSAFFDVRVCHPNACLRGSRTRRVPCDIKNVDIHVEVVEGAIKSDYWCVSLLHIYLFISLILLLFCCCCF